MLYRVDDLNHDQRNRQFYKSLENQETQTDDQVLNGDVNSGGSGGIADLYFRMDEGEISNKKLDPDYVLKLIVMIKI